MNRSDITSLLENVRKTLATSHILNFDNPLSLSDGDYYNLTGLSKQQFNELSSYIVSARQTNVRSVRTCIAVLLTKLRTGLPNHILGTIFSLAKSQVQRCIHSARVSLMQDFVPHFIGFQHISHEDFVRNHTTPIAKTLFANDSEDAAIIVMDGTYIYLQKSADYEFQRLSYSLHKNRPLVKPMVIVGTDGYILSVLGPYFANGKNNDAAITKHMISVNAEGMNEWLETSDVCVVDRGFRDVVDFLKEQGYNVEMPVYLKKGSKQHPVEEANASRLVTKVRWVVESVNARVKQWRFFDKVVSNHFIPIIGDLLRIVCAVCNKFRPPLAGTHPEDKSIAEAMLEKCKKGNAIQKMVTEEGLLTKRTIYKLVDASNVLDELADFPVLSMDKLREITMGVYQLKQAPNYVREHEGEDGKFELYVCKIKENLLKIKIQSRHSNKLSHTVFISYSDEGDIEGWYCTCKSGARVVVHMLQVCYDLDDGYDIDKDILLGIYDRIKLTEFRAGVDHVTQVMKVEQTIVGKKPQLALPHRRLVCYCRLYEVHDPNKKEKIGLHQREVFLFNDCLLVTKILSKKKSGITYSFKQSFTLAGMHVYLYETSHYQFGVRLTNGLDGKTLITFNARNDHDRQKFVGDLKEAIAECNGMEQLRIEDELNKQSANHNSVERYANDDSRVLMYELSKPSDPALNRLSAPECGGLKQLHLSNSLTDLCEVQGMRRGSSGGSLDSGVASGSSQGVNSSGESLGTQTSQNLLVIKGPSSSSLLSSGKRVGPKDLCLNSMKHLTGRKSDSL
ncbi:IQSEC [Mytilus edulis]|uniref:IQSEC n=1 Tax=Mytilus edulis TaxID=6550 RepID=A0A8S3PLL1_MYTED|nr:IQSEC [Mytilus edulis]